MNFGVNFVLVIIASSIIVNDARNIHASASGGKVLRKRALFGGPSGDSGLESCKIYQDKDFLALFDHVCEKCYEIFRKDNLHIQCRANCFNNELFTECARVIMEDELLERRVQYLD